MKLPITGSIGILIRAVQSGVITVTEAENAFDRIKQSNRHISKNLLDKAIEIIRETT